MFPYLVNDSYFFKDHLFQVCLKVPLAYLQSRFVDQINASFRFNMNGNSKVMYTTHIRIGLSETLFTLTLRLLGVR